MRGAHKGNLQIVQNKYYFNDLKLQTNGVNKKLLRGARTGPDAKRSHGVGPVKADGAFDRTKA